MKKKSSRFTDPRLEQIFNLEELPEVTLAITVDNWNRTKNKYPPHYEADNKESFFRQQSSNPDTEYPINKMKNI